MSIETEKKDQNFRDWKQNMEMRAEAYVAKAQMHEPKLLQESTGPVPTKAIDGAKLEVQEDGFEIGVWNVIMNGRWMSAFRGPTAHRDALRFVNDLLK